MKTYLSGSGSMMPIIIIFFPGLIPPLIRPLKGTVWYIRWGRKIINATETIALDNHDAYKHLLYQNTRDVFFIRGDKPRISKRVKVKIIFGVLQTRKRRFKKPLDMRNAIKHEPVMQMHRTITTRTLHLHFSFKHRYKQDAH